MGQFFSGLILGLLFFLADKLLKDDEPAKGIPCNHPPPMVIKYTDRGKWYGCHICGHKWRL